MGRRQKAIERWRIAGDPTTSPCELLELAENRNFGIREAIARNPSTPVSVLDAFAIDLQSAIRAVAAANHSSPDTLEVLSKDTCLYVRQAVAANPAASRETIISLANDPLYDVRVQVLKNPSAPPEVWEPLIDQLSLRPRRRATCNAPCHLDLVKRLARDPDRGVRYSIGCNSNLDEEALLWLAKNGDFQVLTGISQKYENLSEDVRNILRKSLEISGYDLSDRGGLSKDVSLTALPAEAARQRNAAHSVRVSMAASRTESLPPEPSELSNIGRFRQSSTRTWLVIAIVAAWLIGGWWAREADACVDAGGRWQTWSGYCARPADG